MGMHYQYKRLDSNNFTAHSLDVFVRHQTVTACWRKIGKDWKLVPNVYEENWSQAQCREIAEDVAHSILARSTASGSLGLRPSPTVYSEPRQDMCSWFVFRSQRNTGVRVSAGGSFPWPAKRPGGWARTNCIFRRIPQKSHRRHTGHLAAVLQKKSMRNWLQRSPLTSKWNTDYRV